MKLLIVATLFCISVAIIYEAENGVYTGTTRDRSAASNFKTVALTTGGEIEWEFSLCFDSNTVSVKNMTVTYTNDGGSDTLYVYLDSNYVGQIVTHSQSQGGSGWNVPYDSHIIGPFDLVDTASTHSIKIVAQSTDTYNVEIDKLTMYLSTASASVGQCYLTLNGISNMNMLQPIEMNDLFIMKDYSINTLCAEEDNILIYVLTNDQYTDLMEIDTIDVVSTYPVYFEDNPTNHRGADFTSCNFSNSNEAPGIETTTTLYNNGYLLIESVHVSNWWLNDLMTVSVDGGESVSDAAYWRVTQKLDYDVSDYQQTFVMYQDGNIRLLPHPPSCYGDWIPFGSSVIIGNTISDIQENRPYSSVESVNILRTNNYKYLIVDVKFNNGDSMSMDINVAQNFTQITAHNINFSNQTGSLVTFRSMFVSNYNNDVDSVRINGNSVYGIMQLSDPNSMKGSVFEFGRKCVSKHNTLSPDISFILRGHLITKQPTTNPSFYPTINPSVYPTIYPTVHPSIYPTTFPTNTPSMIPTMNPTLYPTKMPTNIFCFYLEESIADLMGVYSTDFIVDSSLQNAVYNYTYFALLFVTKYSAISAEDWLLRITDIGGDIEIKFKVCLEIEEIYHELWNIVNSNLSFIGEYVQDRLRYYFENNYQHTAEAENMIITIQTKELFETLEPSSVPTKSPIKSPTESPVTSKCPPTAASADGTLKLNVIFVCVAITVSIFLMFCL